MRVGAGGTNGGRGAVPLQLARRYRLLRDRGIFAPLEPPETALAHAYTDAEAARIAELRKAAFVGTGAQVAARITELAERLDVQEMAVVTWACDEVVRHQSYRLLAEAVGLARHRPAGSGLSG